MPPPPHRRRELRRGRLAALLALLAVTTLRVALGEELADLFTAMGAARYDVPPPAHARLAVAGDARVESVDSPDAVGAAAADALAVRPTPAQPATATVALPLSAANYGANRLHAFVRLSAGYAATLPAGAAAVTAALAPEHSPAAVLAGRLSLAKAADAALPDEWHEVMADFYLLPEELGAEGQRMQVRLTLGSAAATGGAAWLSGVTLSAWSVWSSYGNVAQLEAVAASMPSEDSSGNVAVADTALSDGFTTDPVWMTFDTPNVAAIWFVVELPSVHTLCSARVHFQIASKVTDWSLELVEDEGGLSPTGAWAEALRVADPAWPESTYTASQAQAVISSDEYNAATWETTIWRYQELDDNPISSNPRYFACARANRAKLSVLATKNSAPPVALTEIELFGYEQAIDGQCQLRCRHGGRCRFASESVCACPAKWGWQGALCDEDVDECGLDPAGATASNRVPRIVAANGGCGGGQASFADCTNTPGSWNCSCNAGFDGAGSSGAGNTCTDINECHDDDGGCADICLNLPGSYRCACNEGYAPVTAREQQQAAAGNESVAAVEEPGFVLHRVTQDSLLGAACDPACAEPCQHGGACTEPDRCTSCDDGWHGRYCGDPACQEARSYRLDGVKVDDQGCYHGGRCAGGSGCTSCGSGWSGDQCETVGGGLAVLVLGWATAALIAPCLCCVLCRRSWPPFQERNVAVLVLGGAGALMLAGFGPAASNPALYDEYSLALEEQPEDKLLGLWLPFVAGYGVWFTALLVRARNLVKQHLQGGYPVAGSFQMLLGSGVWAIVGALPDFRWGATDGEEIGMPVFVALVCISGGYFLILCCQLLPLRRDLDDLIPNMALGALAVALMATHMILRITGHSYANPDRISLNVWSPAALIFVVGVHFYLTVARLVWKLIRKDQEIMEKYETGGDSDEYSDDDAPTARSRWQRGIGGARTAAILKLSSTEGAGRAAGAGGLLARLKKQQDAEGTSDEDGSSAEASSSEEEYTDATESDQEEPAPPLEEASSSEEEEESDSDSDSSHLTPAPAPASAGRGRGRGGRARRGRWSRATRARFRAGGGRGGGARAVQPVDGSATEQPDAAAAAAAKKAAAKSARQLQAAAIFARVAKTVPAEPEPESEDEVLTTSSDDELEELELEVKRFEKMVRPFAAVGGATHPLTEPLLSADDQKDRRARVRPGVHCAGGDRQGHARALVNRHRHAAAHPEEGAAAVRPGAGGRHGRHPARSRQDQRRARGRAAARAAPQQGHGRWRRRVGGAAAAVRPKRPAADDHQRDGRGHRGLRRRPGLPRGRGERPGVPPRPVRRAAGGWDLERRDQADRVRLTRLARRLAKWLGTEATSRADPARCLRRCSDSAV